VDGFNLSYGCLKRTPFKWLNIMAMCRLLLPRNQITSIRYCTAIVSGRGNDQDKPIRQQVYIRALKTIPELVVSFGTFLSHPVTMRLSSQHPCGERYVQVIKTEEKGSDVNLATHLLHDAHLNRYDVAAVISNDSDLLEPIRIVRRELHKQVGILNPQKHPAKVLLSEVDFFKQIRAGVLAKCQFPDELTDAHGTIRKPLEWK
jgi:uncharacterized LabA/DUF88 family protein